MTNKNYIITLSDEELMTKHKESEHAEYFGTLYNRYIPLLYGMFLKYLHDEDKAYHAVVNLFEDLLPQMNNCEIIQFKTWLYRAARNHCAQILRNENKEVQVNFDSECIESESDEVLQLLCEEKDDRERMQALQNCLGRLPDGQRISMIHFFKNKMSYADIAEKTGYSLHTVKTNIQNGKRSLRNCINKHSK